MSPLEAAAPRALTLVHGDYHLLNTPVFLAGDVSVGCRCTETQEELK